jgi:hypothetical protein
VNGARAGNSQTIARAGVVLEGASFVLRDQMRIRLRDRSWRFASACRVSPAMYLGDLTLEFDAVGAVLGHGFLGSPAGHPARAIWTIGADAKQWKKPLEPCPLMVVSLLVESGTRINGPLDRSPGPNPRV